MAGNLVIDSINGVNIAVSPPATQAYANSYDLGVGQTWQNVTGSRVAGTTYTNSTGKPIYLNIHIQVVGTPINTLTIADVIVDSLYVNSSYQNRMQFSGVVPNGATYVVSNVSVSSVVLWSELR